MLADHRRRAAKLYQRVDYTGAELVELVKANPVCAYCGCVLTASTFSLDHAVPISRRADFGISGLRVVCRQCQERKGSLAEDEYRQLLALIATWPPAAGVDVFRRLRAGAIRYAGTRSRSKASNGPSSWRDAPGAI
jgi:hypothetical protein